MSDQVNRSERFVDTSNNDICKSSNLNDLVCFYQGDLIHKRMDAVRKSIYYIRDNWNLFEQFMNNMRNFFIQDANIENIKSHPLSKIFERKRNWCNVEENTADLPLKEEFSVIHTYTTVEGFREIFKIADNIFRDGSSVNFEEKIRSVVFLIELINIDLFNYVHKFPEYQSFEGTVYRGMAISADSFKVYEDLMLQPIEERYISIPLGLWSSSIYSNVAVDFVRDELKKDHQRVPLLMKIRVLNIEDKLLDFYRKKYSQSVVSTICAVYVANLSAFPKEGEVLLRGGFYQALNFYSQIIDDVSFKVLDLVMLNTNRDHLYNPTRLGSLDEEARKLFGNMVGFTRNKYIVEYCKECNLQEDMHLYEKALCNNEKKLRELVGLDSDEKVI
ncbi:uncharacterized protein LOC101237262 [Hydra vulgaris]|uniref:Uncharacterized protein LOC101237262 n=1 Tax=Hydra vulgaris TaxID=6087 RepID=A0ABM4DPR3_HYDVU